MNSWSTRRSFLVAGGLAAASAVFARSLPLRIGVTDWNLNLGAEPEAVSLAGRLGFEGLQVSFGRKIADGLMPVDRPEIIDRYLELSKQYNVVIDGTCVDRLHDNGLKSEPLATKWVRQSIQLTNKLHTKVLLLPFFGKWAITNQSELEHVGDALRDLAPEAEKSGVILGLENTISAEDNVRIMDRARSRAVAVYYDVGNSTHAGFDPVKEIQWLGKDRICQFHLKDNPHYLGEGTIAFLPIVQAIKDIGWSGFANLETDAHGDSLDRDMRRNLSFIRAIEDKVYA